MNRNLTLYFLQKVMLFFFSICLVNLFAPCYFALCEQRYFVCNEEVDFSFLQVSDSISTLNKEVCGHFSYNDVKHYKIVSVKHVHRLFRKSKVNKWIWPVKGAISSGYGWRIHPFTKRRSFHAAIDIKAPYGRKVRSATNGKVILIKRLHYLGKVVKIKYDKYVITYAHLSKILCKKGDKVKQGDVIGLIGMSGRATGPHLHFAVKCGRRYLNPLIKLTTHL